MKTTASALDKVGDDNTAVAWHQLAVLIDDHPLPTHDELAWRAAVRAYRAAPNADLYEAEAVRRTLFRSPYAQLPRSAGNMFLYGALVTRETGKRFAPALLLLWPLSLLMVAPGVVFHSLAAAGVWVFNKLLGRRIARDLRQRAEDADLLADLRSILKQAESPEPVGDSGGAVDEEAGDP